MAPIQLLHKVCLIFRLYDELPNATANLCKKLLSSPVKGNPKGVMKAQQPASLILYVAHQSS